MAASAAFAAPTVQGPSGATQVGQDVVFTIVDQDPSQGFNGSFYLLDLQLGYDPALLQYLSSSTPAGVAYDVFSAPLAGVDPDPAGTYQAELLNFNTPAPGALFNITFRALAASTGTVATISLPSGGAYGDTGNPVFVANDSAPVTITAVVPEPSSWALMGLGMLGLSLAGRRVVGRRGPTIAH